MDRLAAAMVRGGQVMGSVLTVVRFALQSIQEGVWHTYNDAQFMCNSEKHTFVWTVSKISIAN